MLQLLRTIKNKHQLLIQVLCVCFLFLYSHSALAASLSISPATGVYTAGQTITARVIVNTNGAPINAADGTISFNPKELSVVSVAKGSIFNLWTADPAFSNTAGTITFSGGSPTGYTGAAGSVISITFKASAAGSPKVTFAKGSVLAADGRGTNVLSTMNSAAFTISAQEVATAPEQIIEYVAPANTPSAASIESTTHPDQKKWYTVKDALLSWKLSDDIIAVRTALDTNAGSIPTKVYDTPISHISLSDLDEGVSYFHLQLKNKDGWGKVAHYRLAVDSEKPEKFDIALVGTDLSNPSQTLQFSTKDAASVVRSFSIQIDGKDPYVFTDEKATTVATHTLQALEPGHHTVVVEAFDEAHNSIINSISFDILAFDKPKFTEYPSEINEQVIPVIKGVTRPNASVEVSLTQLGLGVSSVDATKVQQVHSNATGEFMYMPDGRLSLGVYELRAVAVDQYGAKSAPSDPIRIAVQQPGYLAIGSFMVSVLSVVVPLVALSVLLFVGIWFFLLRFRRLRKRVNREATEAEEKLSSEFAHLGELLQQQREQLENSRKTKKLTIAESRLFETIERALADSQRRVEKEIEDVEDLVD